jgi:hypothetical protein
MIRRRPSQDVGDVYNTIEAMAYLQLYVCGFNIYFIYSFCKIEDKQTLNSTLLWIYIILLSITTIICMANICFEIKYTFAILRMIFLIIIIIGIYFNTHIFKNCGEYSDTNDACITLKIIAVITDIFLGSVACGCCCLTTCCFGEIVKVVTVYITNVKQSINDKKIRRQIARNAQNLRNAQILQSANAQIARNAIDLQNARDLQNSIELQNERNIQNAINLSNDHINLDIIPENRFFPVSIVIDTTIDITCAICLEQQNTHETWDRLLLCGHQYHKKCIDEWKSLNNRCPICRTNIIIV